MAEQHVPVRAAGDSRDLLTTEDRPALTWAGSGSGENSGLADVAADEARDDAAALLEAMHRLDLAPMYRLAVMAYDAGLRHAGAPVGVRGEMEEFELRLFAARMFLAGVRSQGGAR